MSTAALPNFRQSVELTNFIEQEFFAMTEQFVHQYGIGVNLDLTLDTDGRLKPKTLLVCASIALDKSVNSYSQAKFDYLEAKANDFAARNEIANVVITQGDIL